MRLIALQSGSNGNSVYVEASGTRLLLDAGISGRQAEMRLAAAGVDIRSIDAVIVTHDHRDHIACAGVYQRKFGLPLHVTESTLRAGERHRLGTMSHVRHFTAGDRLRFGRLSVETIPTPHDGVDGVAVVIDDGRHRLGVLTDLGHPFSGLEDVIASLDAILLESNYDEQMLLGGPYPAFLQNRIRGHGGHLSNEEAAALLAGAGAKRLKWACLGHLSADNNMPDLALRASRRRVGRRFPIHLATRHAATEPLRVA